MNYLIEIISVDLQGNGAILTVYSARIMLAKRAAFLSGSEIYMLVKVWMASSGFFRDGAPLQHRLVKRRRQQARTRVIHVFSQSLTIRRKTISRPLGDNPIE